MNKISLELSDTVKGILVMLAGIILLLNTLGITAKVIYTLMLCGSVLMILYGFVKAGFYDKIMNMIKGKPGTDA